MDTLVHLTLPTGHSTISPRSEVHPDTLLTLAPILGPGHHPIPGLDGFSVMHVPVPGENAAVFTVYPPGLDALDHPLVTCGVVWHHASSEALWDHIERLYLQVSESGGGAMLGGGALAAEPVMPGSVPWLAVILLPGIIAHPDAAAWLGDFERCYAWALIEGRPFR